MPGCPRRNVLTDQQLVHLFAFTNKRRWTPPHDFFQGIFLPQNAIAPRNTHFSLVLPVPPENCPPLPLCSGWFWCTLTALLCRKDPSEEEDQQKKTPRKRKMVHHGIGPRREQTTSGSTRRTPRDVRNASDSSGIREKGKRTARREEKFSR
uniref:(northern house mosquito) hypothetical protein n=1 Tax=Culex pipiens TaxID=7175 RepID=A0A8D8HNU5_CULPI